MRGAWPACLGAVGWGRAPITHWGLMASLRRRTVARSSAHAALKGPLPRLGVLGGFVVVLVASALPLAWASPSGPVSLGAATKASIHQVRISGSSIAFAPTRQRGVPTARFSVTLPSDATRLTYVHFELRGYTNAAQSSFRTLLVNITCSSKTACKKSGSTVDVTLPLRFAIDWWTAGLLHPGTYHPYVLVYTDSPSAGPASVELSTPTVAVRRRTRIKPFDAAPEPVHRGRKVTITGRLQRAKSCLDPMANCGVGTLDTGATTRQSRSGCTSTQPDQAGRYTEGR
jgi:hypothetical protein